MVVARPVEPTSADFQSMGCNAPIVPTKLLTDPEELDRQLLENGYSPFCNYNQSSDCAEEDCEDDKQVTQIEVNVIENNMTNMNTSKSVDTEINQVNSKTNGLSPNYSYRELKISQDNLDLLIPDTKRFTVELTKNDCGLGITIAGYVCEREDLSGIFIKSLSEGSAAYKSQQININDRIIEVDGHSLQGFTNYEAVEKLKQTGSVVKLTLERYLRGPKFEQLLEALATQDQKDISPPSPSVTTLSWIPIDSLQVKCLLNL